MKFRDALDDAKRHEGHETRFPGERRTTNGLFTGFTPANESGRLVHVGPGGAVRDFGYPLTGRTGLDGARLGVERDGGVVWLDECETVAQSYRGETTLVVTEHRLPGGERLTQYDLTLGAGHATHVEFDGSDAAALVAFLGFAPEGRDTGVAQLHHADAVEVYHDAERDFVASATGFETARGCVPADFAELLGDDPVGYPGGEGSGRREEASLSGDVYCELPFEDGATTLGTLLTDAAETSRERALDRIGELTAACDDAGSLERAAAERAPALPDGLPDRDAVAADLRVLGLLSAPTGLRIAGPEFDPYYAHSGGYGYTWFRDDAEIARFLLRADRQFGLGLDEWHARSAESYCETQLAGGAWPHRVWPRNRRLAPGWANSHLAVGEEPDYRDYQADQTASVVAYLADALPALDSELAGRATETLADALDGLDRTLADDGLPVACQNAWEDATGRFAHTAATFLEAYATAADADADLGGAPAARADRVYDGLAELWAPDRGIYGYRIVSDSEDGFEPGELDDRCDSGSLALASAHLAYDRIGEVDDRRLDRLASHVRTVVDELHRDPASGAVRGLVRYEGDDWRARSQDGEKIWTVSTAWGAYACASLAALLADRAEERAAEFAGTARDLLGLVLPDGPLCPDGASLPEQVFDDGTPDSATPLGWPHALRTATLALLEERDLPAASAATEAER